MGEREAKQRTRGLKMIIPAAVVLVCVAVLVVVFQRVQDEQALEREEDRIDRELVQPGRYGEAALAYEELLPRLSGEHRQRIEREIVVLSLNEAGDETRSISETARWLELAAKYDPSALSEAQRRLLEVQRKRDAGN